MRIVINCRRIQKHINIFLEKFWRNNLFFIINFILRKIKKMFCNLTCREKRLVKREARTKRELQIDPQELLALLALWEAEQSRKQQTAATAEMK